MYKILVKYPSEKITNLWQAHGTIVTTGSSISNSTETKFTEFATDDIEVLKSELLLLDQIYGHENIRVIKEIDVNYTVEVTDTDAENTEPTDPDTPSGDNTGE